MAVATAASSATMLRGIDLRGPCVHDPLGWYAANDGSIRSKGTMYFVLHPHGLNMSGRWVGLGYDDKIMTGWGSMAKTAEDAGAVIERLNQASGQVART